jgi:hypothetical protein
MTVKELIEELQKYSLEMRVYLNDSEWGAEESQAIAIRKNEWIWDGPNHTVEDVVEIS